MFLGKTNYTGLKKTGLPFFFFEDLAKFYSPYCHENYLIFPVKGFIHKLYQSIFDRSSLPH